MPINNIFVAMPFGTKKANNHRYLINFDDVYNKAIVPAANELGLSIIRADEEEDGGLIHVLMIERLICTDIAIVDITNENPNVYYELGLRHCARPQATILIYDKSTRLPFDIQPLRAIPYELNQGVISDEAANTLKENIKTRIISVINCDYKCDSLPFALIDKFPKTELDPEMLQIYQELFKKRASFKTMLENVQDIEDIKAVINKMEEDKFPLKLLIYELIKSYQKFNAWNELIDFINQKLDDETKSILYVKQQEALAYNKRGIKSNSEEDLNTSINLLIQIIKNYGASAETYGLIGSAYKRFAIAKKTDMSYKSYLERAILHYREGFNFDSRDFYTGINLATLLLVKGTEEAIMEFKRITPVLQYNIELNDLAMSNDYWLLATAYELYIQIEKFSNAEKILGYIVTLSEKPTEWMIRSTLTNLSLIKENYELNHKYIGWYNKYESLLK